MYTGWTRLLIVFLTHPGLLVSVPASGMLMLWGRGLLQASVVLAMHGASETRMSQIVEYLYWGTFLFWAWIKVEVADKSVV
jgi:hypothetical protein